MAGLTPGRRRVLVAKSLRVVRQWYRKADTAGELLERELDRLIKRNTQIMPHSLMTANDRLQAFKRAVEQIQPRLMDALSLSSENQ